MEDARVYDSSTRLLGGALDNQELHIGHHVPVFPHPVDIHPGITQILFLLRGAGSCKSKIRIIIIHSNTTLIMETYKAQESIRSRSLR